MKYTAEECEKLEGKEITMVCGDGPEDKDWVFTGLVIGCHPDIGITIVDKNNKTFKLACLNGPMSKEYNAHKAFYGPAFEAFVEAILNDSYSDEKMTGIATGYDPNYNPGSREMAECPFT